MPCNNRFARHMHVVMVGYQWWCEGLILVDRAKATTCGPRMRGIKGLGLDSHAGTAYIGSYLIGQELNGKETRLIASLHLPPFLHVYTATFSQSQTLALISHHVPIRLQSRRSKEAPC